ncbi:hypothetical protein E4U43_000880, partial [Claviceps pusilla]
FGSKDDWKRHESTQHYNTESWICREEGCEHECNRRESFKLHLRNDHCLSVESIDHKVEQCRQGRNWDTEFWCGFCVKYIEVDRTDGAGNAWIQRVDHIEAHFCGKGTFVKQRIEEWRYQEEMAVGFQGFLDETRLSTSVAMSQTAPLMSVTHKRLASPMDSEPRGRKRAKNKWVEMWQCCGCDMFMNVRTSSTCVSCGRYQCSECRVTKHALLDEGVAAAAAAAEESLESEMQEGLYSRCLSLRTV